MDEIGDLRRVQSAAGGGLIDDVNDALSMVVRRGEAFRREQPSGSFIETDEVGKSAADIGREADHRLSP